MFLGESFGTMGESTSQATEQSRGFVDALRLIAL